MFYSALATLHCVDVDSVADVSEVHAVSIVKAEVSRVDECPYIVINPLPGYD
jgi:hypothetical protein